MDKLLPCPCCKGNARFGNEYPADNSGGYFVECEACFLTTKLIYACGEDPKPLLAELWNRRAQTVQQEQEPVYAFRRKGLSDDFVTCSKERYEELSEKAMFDVTIFYTHPPADAQQQEIERLKAQKPAAWKYQNAYHGNQWFFTAHQTDLATYNAMNVKPLFAYPPDAATRIAELEADNARLIREMLVLSVDHEAQLAEYKADAERYRRTRILGAAINECTPLLRFTNLDVFIDRDIKVNPSRGEFKGGENV